jgi:hypothetical protein
LREITGADGAVLYSRFFGTGLSSGPLYSYRFDEFFPSTRNVVIVKVNGAALKAILSRANVDASTPVRPLRTYFLYASDITPREDELYTLVTSEEVARFAERLLGTAELNFEPIPATTVKALLRETLER